MATTTKPFQAERDTDDPDSPYLLIQRQFEDADDHRCYIETHDEKYCGHFRLRRVDFTPQKLSIELDRPWANLVSVTFAMAATEFAEASEVVKIIDGEIDPLSARCLIKCPNWVTMSPRTAKLNDSFRVRTRQICCFAPNGGYRRYLAVGARVSEGPESTLSRRRRH